MTDARSAGLAATSAPPESVVLGARLSVVICTHNPKESYLSRVIEALRAQTVPPDSWELLIVDNGSREPVAERFELGWHPSARVVRDEHLGLTPARLRGIRESTGDPIVFVDDDNFLDPNYLEQARLISTSYPFIGAWSGQSRPEFDEPPPKWTRRYWGNLVIREFDFDVWSNLPRLAETMPCGAGLCVRRLVAERYSRKQSEPGRIQLDRRGTSLVSGGDNDLAAYACDLGMGLGLFSSLKLTHKIPKERLTLSYLARLAEGVTFAATLLDAQRGQRQPSRTLACALMEPIRQARLGLRGAIIARSALRGRKAAERILNRPGAHPDVRRLAAEPGAGDMLAH